MKYIIIISIIIILLWIFFHRSPTYDIDSINDNIVYSPAFGKIMGINEKDGYIHIAIFLSPLDVHIQYIPINGIVIDQKHDITGKFELAYDLNKSRENEKVITTIKPNINIPNVYVYQIAGKLVRRIKSYINKYPRNVVSKQKLGIIRLGSRVDIMLPKENFKVIIKEGDRVNGPKTILGIYNIKN
jgi:phosphatidylserine decarboxylase